MRDLTPTDKKINSKIGKAIHDYSLIEEGDRILVAVSGGKDSLTLLRLLSKIKGWAPVKFSLIAAHVESDIAPSDKKHIEFLKNLSKTLGVPIVFKNIKIKSVKGSKVNCFWCSWNRRKTLFELAAKLGCNKVALGHHKDDIIETILMNLFYNGEISAMNPKQEMFGGKITIIRPLCYVDEKLTRQAARENGFAEYTCTCSFADHMKRKFIKNLIARVQADCPKVDIKTNIFKGVARIRKDYINIKEE